MLPAKYRTGEVKTLLNEITNLADLSENCAAQDESDPEAS
jgi:hypothetical protein